MGAKKLNLFSMNHKTACEVRIKREEKKKDMHENLWRNLDKDKNGKN